jgi:colanic acid biosynthesis glycosyl transferase WcaI
MKVLILNQAFYPDVVATAQYGTELAQALVQAGHEVHALAASRGYDDPKQEFSAREVWGKIQIFRVSSLGLGKGSKLRRACEFAWFMAACGVRLLFLARFDVIVCLTSPPIISFLAAWVKVLKKSKLVYWTMDINPDEAIAAGWLRADSLVAKGLVAAQSFSIRKSDRIVVLDRFMEERLRAASPASSIAVIAPWPHDCVAFNQQGRGLFRKQHGLTDKFVIMYSGNHSPCHPLTLLLEAAIELQHDDGFRFTFVGGGSEFLRVKKFASDRGLGNIITLPYQPKQNLSSSLAAADLHVVVMGDPFVGIIHPCKIYNILALGAPFLYIGPSESHITDLVSRLGPSANCFASVRHGDIAATVLAIRNARSRATYGASALKDVFKSGELPARFVSTIESLRS